MPGAAPVPATSAYESSVPAITGVPAATPSLAAGPGSRLAGARQRIARRRQRHGRIDALDDVGLGRDRVHHELAAEARDDEAGGIDCRGSAGHELAARARPTRAASAARDRGSRRGVRAAPRRAGPARTAAPARPPGPSRVTSTGAGPRAETAITSTGSPASATAAAPATRAPRSHSCGSASARSAVRRERLSARPVPSRAPSSSTTAARTPDMPTSMPSATVTPDRRSCAASGSARSRRPGSRSR